MSKAKVTHTNFSRRFVSQWSLREKSACVRYRATTIYLVHAPLMLLAMPLRHKLATQIGVCNRSLKASCFFVLKRFLSVSSI